MPLLLVISKIHFEWKILVFLKFVITFTLREKEVFSKHIELEILKIVFHKFRELNWCFKSQLVGVNIYF